MKKAMVVRTEDCLEYYQYTSKVLKKFAKIWSCDYIEIKTQPEFLTDDNKPHWKILEVKSILKKYERVLLCDADIIITTKCPNPFELASEKSVASVFEDVGSRQLHRRAIIKLIQKRFGEIGWERNYINTGFFLLSQMHEVLFDPIDGFYWTDFGSDDVHFGYQAFKNNIDIVELPFYWNHMSMFSEDWNNFSHRFDSYIIHYAGQANFPDKGNRSRNQLIYDDFKQIWSSLC